SFWVNITKRSNQECRKKRKTSWKAALNSTRKGGARASRAGDGALAITDFSRDRRSLYDLHRLGQDISSGSTTYGLSAYLSAIFLQDNGLTYFLATSSIAHHEFNTEN